MVRYRSADMGGHRVFCREAGEPGNPAVLLLHGFPTSSHMFRDLIPLLADRYRVLETHAAKFAAAMRSFLGRVLAR